MNNDLVDILSKLTQQDWITGRENLDKLTLSLKKQGYVKIIQRRLYQDYLNTKEDVRYSFRLEKENLGVLKNIPKKLNNWNVEHKNVDGSIVASRDGCRRFLRAGQYFIVKDPFEDEQASFYKNYVFFENDFVQVYGNYVDETFPQELCRIYFNLQVGSILNWAKFVSDYLISLGFYFHFKFIADGNGSRRSDNAVLYIEKNNFRNVIPMLRILMEMESSIFFHPELPLFTRRLAPGIAFAENPVDPNESFGTSRCRLIAEAIVEAHESNVVDVKSYVLDYIESKGYDLDKFYLNPGSRFEYDFSAF